ncbi:hypothetical protein EVAR_53310_1 [Eumeta japonica]|uniref:Uncharacterized protein n=1 Tax=Eumeta variegata TaxID=151549 RepID=A0A4C1XA84_EUMVA|nr:hypothetical protein EVAR_53310_1 [Eumeta japonica]
MTAKRSSPVLALRKSEANSAKPSLLTKRSIAMTDLISSPSIRFIVNWSRPGGLRTGGALCRFRPSGLISKPGVSYRYGCWLEFTC